MAQQWKQSKGLTIIYVGDGKGKTTAAVGMAARALGHGWRVYFLQFMKEEKWPSGERDFLRNILSLSKDYHIKIETAGEGFVGIMGDKKERDIHKAAAQAGYEKAMRLITNTFVPEPGLPRTEPCSGTGVGGATEAYQLVILDEILSAVDEQLLTEDQILALMAQKPEDITLVMTGHKHYPRIFEKADLVTDMKKLKHPFDAGYIAKKGIDY